MIKESGGLTVPVLSLKGEETGRLEVPKEISEVKTNQTLLVQVIRVYLANQKKGNASTKTRAEVRGGGRKPWKQKGTGRARQGSIRAPHWRGGGVIFGPQPKKKSFSLPKKMRRLALLAGLRQKITDKEVVVVNKLEEISGKTKDIKHIIIDGKKNLIVYTSFGKKIIQAARNRKEVGVKTLGTLNVYDLFVNKHLIFTRSAFNNLSRG